MVQIEQVDIDDIPEKVFRGAGERAEEYSAVRSLDVGQAIAFPCRWHHSGNGGSQCAGVMNINNIARRYGWELRATCTDETGDTPTRVTVGKVYVGRIS